MGIGGDLMLKLYENIRAFRKAANMTQDELAKKTGYTDRSSIARIEKGEIDLPHSKIEQFASALGTSPSTLMGWDDDDDFEIPVPEKRPYLTKNILPMPNTVKVPRVGAIACGTPILAEQNIDAYDPVPDYVKCDFTLVCKGDSMINARIYDGDIVCIKLQPEVEDGEIAAVLVGDDEATLKRVRYYPDHIVLEPENPMYKPLVFWEERMNDIRIIGKATHFISAVR